MENIDAIIAKIISEHLSITEQQISEESSVDIVNALKTAYAAGAASVQPLKEDKPVAALLKPSNDTVKRMRELAGIPHRGNYI